MDPGILGTELAQSWRSLLRKPRFLAVAVSTLALGIAASASVFTLVHQMLLQQLPFAQPERLATLGMSEGQDDPIASPFLYRRLQGLSGVTSMGIANAYLRKVNVSAADTPVVASVLVADRGFLDTLGVKLAAGRNFSAAEDHQGGARVGLLSHGFWKTRFGGDYSVIDRTIDVEGGPLTVIGVMPSDFVWPQAFDLLTPMRLPKDSADTDTNQYVIARMSPGTGLASLSAEAEQRMRVALEERRPTLGNESFAVLQRMRYGAKPLDRLYNGDIRPTLWLFFAAAMCVMLIAAINLANLMMLRTVVRSHDSAVRAALGASSMRLAMPAFGEALLIAFAGTAMGIALAWAGLRLFAGSVPAEWMHGKPVALGWAAWAFAIVFGLLTALGSTAFGVHRGQRSDLLPELFGGGRSGMSRRVGWLGRSLVVAQVAVAAVLLIGAGLFMRNLYEMSSVPLGFKGDGAMTFSLSPVRAAYPDIDAVKRQTRDIAARLQELPGVERVAVSSNLPTGSQLNFPATVAGRAIQPQFRPVNADYFAAFSIPVLDGRLFTERDNGNAEPVCIVSRSFSNRYFGGKAIGQSVRMGAPDSDAQPPMRVVGVVGDVRFGGPTQDIGPTLYVPIEQLSGGLWQAIRQFTPLHYAVRVHGSTADYEPRLRRAVTDVTPTQAIADVRPMQAVVDETMGGSRLQLLLVGIFAALALTLASVGLYAVLAVTATARGHEYGVRVALGAKPRQLVGLVLKDALTQIGIGLALGLMIAAAISGTVEHFLFGVRAIDPLVIAAASLTLLATGLLASALPALRVARTDPMQALRVE